MVFHLPNEETVRENYNYTQAFAMTLVWNIGLLGMVVTVLFLAFLIAKKYMLRVASNKEFGESILTAEERSSSRSHIPHSDPSSSELHLEEKIQNPKSVAFKLVNFFTSFFFYLFWVVASLIYLAFFMFGYFGRGTHVDLLSVFVIALALILPTLIWKHKTKVTKWVNLRREAVFTMIMLLLWLGVSIFGVIATKGTCGCYYNDMYGFGIGVKDMRISTQFTRTLQLQAFPDEMIRHLYATVPEDASTGVFFNAHTGISNTNLTFTLKLNGNVLTKKASTSPFFIDNVETLGRRSVHSVLFTDLQPDTTYSLQVSDGRGIVIKQANYKTTPGANAKKLKMAIGGDLGMNAAGKKMTMNLVTYSPDVIIIGGDTTYDDGMRTCYSSWDDFYSLFEPVYIHPNINRLIPLILSVGNHDVGFDALTDNRITASDQYLPLFFVMNPQHISSTGDVPAVLDRMSYHSHLIGPTLHLNLDSGYLKHHREQVDFIKLQSQNHKNRYLFANYHNPIYPSCTNSHENSNDRKVIAAGLKYWTPLFDFFGFIASLEHHTHQRKITFKIKNQTQDNTGTRYIGDGSWGVTEQVCDGQRVTPRKQLMQQFTTRNPNHMWQVTLTLVDEAARKYQISYTAIRLNGTVIDKAGAIDDLPILLP